MKKLFVAVLLFVCASATAQTTYILVRHAEKEATASGDQMNSKDPNLSKEGLERAKLLAHILEKQKIDAIFSTNFSRTRSTAKPLADANGLEIQIYDKQPDLSKVKGTVVIVGHSNTIPALANTLIGKEQFKTFDDSDYGNLLIIKDGFLTHLRY